MRIMMMMMAIYLNSLMMMVLVMMASVPKYISSKMLQILMGMMMVVVEVEIHVGKFWQIQETGKSPRGSLRPKNGVERFSAGSDWLWKLTHSSGSSPTSSSSKISFLSSTSLSSTSTPLVEMRERRFWENLVIADTWRVGSGRWRSSASASTTSLSSSSMLTMAGWLVVRGGKNRNMIAINVSNSYI